MGMKSVRKKRSRTIKFLLSWIPEFLWKFLIPETPRMHISSNLVQDIYGLTQNSPYDESDTSFCNMKPNFQARPLQHMYNSTPKKDIGIENEELKPIQQQLHEIKQLVARLIEMQSELCSGYGTLSCPSDHLQKSFVPPPPPPPPPPLPPENFSLPVNKPVIDHIVPNKKNNQFGLPCGKELLKALKKVQLKKTEKSPGGGPLKKSQIRTDDPGGFLAEVLKKRFGRLHNSPDSSLESGSIESENSYISATINC